MSLFYVTAIRHSSDPAFISHILIHSPNGKGRMNKGVILSKADVINHLENGHEFKTAVFNYSTGQWNNGADIGTVRIGLTTYLRTDKDSTTKDNLGNLLLIDELR
ncbi:DUF3892 domain-containing protein [Pedobacter roseus]|uniref:DUF3892 domain-containing protein n=1 Tax=Pedobacter roseus TaxID=336820 RepID=A0A7G9QMB9_9SPHI|nr:DUF3892 domain-containing protein [Pedobacter roseus]QNN44494.1 DUF3892 domain-containing protein [Pedobacter roseus]